MAGINLSGILYIYRTRLGSKAVILQEVFAILGIAVGVALLFASQVASTSLTSSVTQLNSQFVGNAEVQLDARGPEGVDERLVREVLHEPGVQSALPVFVKQMNILGNGRGRERPIYLIGVNPQTVRLKLSSPILRRFSAKQLAAQQAIALPGPLASELNTGPLESVKVQIGASFVETLVGATLSEADIGALAHSPVAVTSIRYAQLLTSAHGKINWIFVHYEPGQAKVAHAALQRLASRWHVNLVPGGFAAQQFSVAVAPESRSETLFSAISALVGFMFALNAMLITVPSRRALIDDVRPHGASRLDTAKILLFDAAVISLIACSLGLVLGNILSVAVFHRTPSYLSVAFPVGNSRVVAWESFALAIAAGIGAAIIGVFWPLRAILARPLQVAADQPGRQRNLFVARITIGTFCLALTTVVYLADTREALVGNIALVVALVVLMPLLFDVLVSLFEQLSNVIDGVGSALAVTELQTPQTRVRSLAIAATAAVAVFGVVEFQGIQTNLERGLDSSSRDIDAAADVWVLPSGKLNVQPTTQFSANAVRFASLAHLPGVSRVSVFRGSFLDWGDRRLWVIAPGSSVEHALPVGQIVAGDSHQAVERVRRGRWAVISQALATEHHLSVGDSFTLPSPKPTTLRVAALATNLGWPPGALILNASVYANAWGDTSPTAYAIQTSSGGAAVVEQVRDRVRHALARVPGLAVETYEERNRRRDAIAAQGLSRLTQIRLLVLIAAILAIIGSMGAMIWQRRDLIAFIKVQGYEERTLRRWLLSEAGILLTVGCSIGAIFGLYAQLLGSRYLATVTGFPITLGIEGFAAATSFMLVSVIALIVVALPGYLVVRVPANTASPAY